MKICLHKVSIRTDLFVENSQIDWKEEPKSLSGSNASWK